MVGIKIPLADNTQPDMAGGVTKREVKLWEEARKILDAAWAKI